MADVELPVSNNQDFVDAPTDADRPIHQRAAAKEPQMSEDELPELILDDPEPDVLPPKQSFEITADVPATGSGIAIDHVAVPGAPSADVKVVVKNRPLKIEAGGAIGPYELIEQIGEGGMAAIFRARDSRNGRIVAVKALHAHQKKGLAGKRFQREFRHIKRLNHPNIVTVMEYSEEQGQPYIVMEYVKGHDLKHHLKILRKLPNDKRWHEVESLVVQICRALEHVHGRNLIHRDLKPSNILLDSEGRAKLTDFGVVKPQDASVQLTQAGMLVGTLAYLAPEVFEQTTLDHRLDLYALGVMLYVMLTNKLPFSGKNISQIMQKHLRHIPDPPRKLNSDAPEHLERITLKLLEKKKEDRYQSAAEVIRAIEQYRSAVQQAELLEPETTDLVWVPRLVGRGSILVEFRRAIATLARGKGGLLLIEGPQGVGKTRLVESALSYAQSYGITPYTGRCLAGGQAWGEGFRRVVNAIEAEIGRVGGAPEALPQLKQHYGLEERPAPQAPPEETALDFKRRLSSLFLNLTLKSPRAVWLDDLDQADTGTLAGVGRLARKLIDIGAPLLLIGTIQTGRRAIAPDLQALVEGQVTEVKPRRIRIDPLKEQDVLELLRTLFPSDERTEVLAERLMKESRGLPLMVVEILRLWIAQGRIGLRLSGGERRWVTSLSKDDIQSGLSLPVGLRGLLLARLAAYPGQTRTLMRLIALWGREVKFGTLLRLASAPEEALSAHIDRLLADGWLVEDWIGGEECYHLAHPTYRAILLNELTGVEKNRLRAFIDRRLRVKS